MAEELPPAPLDAYATAKPDEPTWTVQGGDPLGGPLLLVWAHFARIQAGVVQQGIADNIFYKLLYAANNNPPENDREREALLIRATQTEEVSWDMDAYRAGHTAAEGLKTPAENSLDEKTRLDLHDFRVRSAQKINGMVYDLMEMAEYFSKAEFQTGDANAMLLPIDPKWAHLHSLEKQGLLLFLLTELKRASQLIEPRRLFKRS